MPPRIAEAGNLAAIRRLPDIFSRFGGSQMLIEMTGLQVSFEHPKEEAFAGEFCLTPRGYFHQQPCANALLLKFVAHMQVVEQGPQIRIFRAKGASESGQLI